MQKLPIEFPEFRGKERPVTRNNVGILEPPLSQHKLYSLEFQPNIAFVVRQLNVPVTNVAISLQRKGVDSGRTAYK